MHSQIVIKDFIPQHQAGIDLLLNDIQHEFPETIYGPDAKKMTEVAFLAGRKYWVVLDANEVIGSIGLVTLGNNNSCIKSMLLQKGYRGEHTQIAHKLLMTAINHATGQHAQTVYLGTMIQFKAAQSFYLKNGFVQIKENDLPDDFVKNPVDKIFFKLIPD